MKKIAIIVAIVAVALLASSFTFAVSGGQYTDVRETSVSGHKYIVATSWGENPSRAGGVAIIHSESCGCKSKK